MIPFPKLGLYNPFRGLNRLFYYFYRSKPQSQCDRKYSSETKTPLKQTTSDNDEIQKFGKFATDWWKTDSAMDPLLRMNEVRVPFIREGLLATSKKQTKPSKPLDGFRILDIGCGGGFLSEALARIGANVLGIDPAPECVDIARKHAALDANLKDNLSYECNTIENLVGNSELFDAVVCSEVIEHVDNPDFFVQCCSSLVKTNGSLFFTTLNKTTISYLGAILFAEYIAGIVPKGTHDWNKFISPGDLQKFLESHGCRTKVIHGLLYNPLTCKWSFIPLNSINYALHAVKLE